MLQKFVEIQKSWELYQETNLRERILNIFIYTLCLNIKVKIIKLVPTMTNIINHMLYNYIIYYLQVGNIIVPS